MSPKTGRPKSDNPKVARYNVRIDAETDKKLTEYCATHGIEKAEAIRKGIHLLLVQKK